MRESYGSNFFYELRFTHFMSLLNHDCRIFFAILHEGNATTRLERLANLARYFKRKTQLVIHIDHQHQIDAISRQVRIDLRTLQEAHVGQPLAYGSLANKIQHLRFDIDSKHCAAWTHGLCESKCVVTRTGAKIDNGLAAFEPKRFEHLLGLLFVLACFAFQPEDAARAHHLRDFAIHVELTRAVGIVVAVKLVVRGNIGRKSACSA